MGWPPSLVSCFSSRCVAGVKSWGWSAQDSLDTELGAFRIRLEKVRADAAEMAVPPDRVIE